MKKSTQISSFLLFLSLSIFAQNVKVIARKTLSEKGFNPVLNESGDKLLFTLSSFVGLNLLDLETNEQTLISKDAGAGYEPQFTVDNSQIVYRKTTFENNRRFNALVSFNLKSKQSKLLLAPQRVLNKTYATPDAVIAFAGKNILRSSASKTSVPSIMVSSTEDLKIMLFDGKISYLNPLEMTEPRYIWVSLSPDKSRILFTAAGKGTFICDLKGNVVCSLGRLNAPVWYNNQWVVAMEDKDDGHQIISSKIVLFSLKKKEAISISLAQHIALFPTASAKGNKIAYCTDKGSLELVTVSIQN